MATNKVTINTPEGEQTIMDITDTTATPEMVAEGVLFYGSDGEKKEGNVLLVRAGDGFGVAGINAFPVVAEGAGVKVTVPMLRPALLQQNALLSVYASWSEFGNTAPNQVLAGNEFTSSSGLKQTGTFTIDSELTSQDALLSDILAALAQKLPSRT